MTDNRNSPNTPRNVGVAATLIVGVLYFGFMLTGALDPHALAQPIGSGVLSVGITAGIALIVIIVALAWAYTRYRSKTPN